MPRTDAIDLKEYWLLMKRRKGIVRSSVLAAVALALAVNYFAQPVYRATSQILVLQEPIRSPVTGEVVETRNPYSESLVLDTAAALITNRTLMAQVVNTLRERRGIQRLDEPLSLLQRFTSQIGYALQMLRDGLLSPAQEVLSEEEHQRAEFNEQIELLLGMTSVKPVRNTRLINIHVEHQLPVVARDIADTMAQLFIEYQVQQRAEGNRNLAGYLDSQMSQIKGKIEESERAFYTFKERESLFSLDGTLKANIEMIGGLNASFIKTNTDRLAVGAKLAKLKTMRKEDLQDGGQIPIHSDSLDALRQKLFLSQADVAKAREVYKSQHPKLKALESAVESIRNNISKELDNNIASLEAEHAIFKSREEHLRSAISQRERELHQVSKKALEYSILEREFNTNHDLYNLLLSKLKEADITGKVRPPLIEVVEQATIPKDPIRPMKALNLVLGLLLGVISGMGLAFFTEYFRRTIRTAQDVTVQLRLPVLGMIPKKP
jgi:uncharacterized protein involved in exopolysaccharide biosynthesis